MLLLLLLQLVVVWRGVVLCGVVWCCVREPGLGSSAAPRPGAWGGGSKLPQPQPRKNSCDSNGTMSHVSEITLKRTDTTLDLSQ